MVGFAAFNMYSMAPFYGEMKAEKNGMAAYNIPKILPVSALILQNIDQCDVTL
jgi:hypothetical protein